MSKIEKLLLVLALASLVASCATLGVVLKSGGKLGGVTNLDSLTLSDDLIVGGTITSTGATTMSSLSISGAATITGATSLVGTTTLSNTLILNEAPICISGYATSTATRIKIEFDATAATTTSPIGGLKLNYGACN